MTSLGLEGRLYRKSSLDRESKLNRDISLGWEGGLCRERRLGRETSLEWEGRLLREGHVTALPYIKLLEFAYKSSSVSQLQNWALCKPSFEPKSVNSPKN